MQPKTFSQRPEGGFKRWTGGSVTPADLNRYRPDQQYIFINGIMVYELYFEEDTGEGRKWNCQMGWVRPGML